MKPTNTLDVGLDVHQEAIAVAYVTQDQSAEVTYLGTMGPRPCALDHLIRTLQSNSRHLGFVDDAGPCGSGLYRDLPKNGEACWVVAPALMPTKAGDRVTTDRRDAVQLARLMRSGDLTPVDVPQVEDEALRDLSRAREAAIRDRKAATFRLNACLLRQDTRDTGQAAWGPAHLRWLAAGLGATPAQPIVFPAYVRAVNEQTARLQHLDHDLCEPVHTWRLQPVVEALHALRGVQCTVAVTSVAERGALTCVDTPPQRMRD